MLLPSADIFSLSATDAAVLARIHGECFRDAWNVESFSSMLSKGSFFGFLLKFQQKPVGFVLCNSLIDETEIITMCVLSACRNKGYGKYLLKNVIVHAEQRSLKKIILEVSEDNVGGIALYESIGFQKIARRKGYYQNFCQHGNACDALVMSLATI
jgi:ribosomal-protein-alanine N-acetyltransferase